MKAAGHGTPKEVKMASEWLPLIGKLGALVDAATAALNRYASSVATLHATDATVAPQAPPGVARGDQDLTSFPEDTKNRERERAREPLHATDATVATKQTPKATEATPLPRFGNISIHLALTQELRDIVAEYRLEHLGEVWAAFKGHYDGQTIPSVSGYWLKWCANQSQRDRAAREREGNRARLAKTDTELQAPKADLAHVGLMSETEKRSRQRESKDYAARAVPAPLGGLLAACRPKPKPEKATGS